MEKLVTDTLRDTSLISFWAMAILPILGSVSLTQIWKMQRRESTGRKPPNYQCQLVATLFCVTLSALVYGLIGAQGWSHALGVGLMIGPAAPLLWWMGIRMAPDRLARAMRGGRDPNRDPIILTEWERQQVLHDTLYGDSDSTIRDKIRRAREQHDREHAKGEP